MRWLPALLLVSSLAAEDRYTLYRSGPFEVLSSGADRQARAALNHLEQLRHAMERWLGKQEMRPVWPIRIVLRRGSRAATSAKLGSSREAWMAGLAGDGHVPRALLASCARLLFDDCAGRMPAPIEHGFIDLVSTIEARATRVSLHPLPPAERTLDWARLHLLASSDSYSGKLRVLLVNLGQGMDPEPAFRNAFEKSQQAINEEAAAYFQAGIFGEVPLSARPIDPDRDFLPRELEPAESRLVAADLLLAEGRREDARAAYQAILASDASSAGAHEGLGLLAAGDAARQHFQAAVKLGSRNARAHAGAGAFEAAARLNPRWAEPYLLDARQEKNPKRKTLLLRKAAQLEPRNAALWQSLAEHLLEVKEFAESDRAWLAAERAAASDSERNQIRLARRQMEERRQEAEAAERRRIAMEKQAELDRLRNDALREVRLAEERARRNAPPLEEGKKVEEWWDGPRASGRVTGVLERMDCLPGGSARLVVRPEGGKPAQILIRDPGQVVVQGGGQQALYCGPQKPARRVTVEYLDKPDKKLGTAGEAVLIDFR